MLCFQIGTRLVSHRIRSHEYYIHLQKRGIQTLEFRCDTRKLTGTRKQTGEKRNCININHEGIIYDAASAWRRKKQPKDGKKHHTRHAEPKPATPISQETNHWIFQPKNSFFFWKCLDFQIFSTWYFIIIVWNHYNIYNRISFFW